VQVVSILFLSFFGLCVAVLGVSSCFLFHGVVTRWVVVFISPWVVLVGPVGGDGALSLLLYLSFKCYILEIYIDLASLCCLLFTVAFPLVGVVRATSTITMSQFYVLHFGECPVFTVVFFLLAWFV